MNVTAHKLNDLDFDVSYKDTVFDWTDTETSLLSLTFTLNPLYNNADILTQYKAIIRAIRDSNVFYYKLNKKQTEITIHPDFIKMYLVPELTPKNMNIHLHGILLIVKGSENYFINEMRRLCWKHDILGRQHAVKIVDNNIESKNAIACYALKDLSEMNKVIDKSKIYKYSFESNIEE